MLVYPNGEIEGTIGGGKLEFEVIEKAKTALEKKQSVKFNFKLDADLGMSCGGYTEVYIEPLLPELQLYIFGAGHIGKALAQYAPDFGFGVSLIDPRENILDGELPANIKWIKKGYVEACDEIDLNSDSYIVIVSPQHKYDEAILERVAKMPHAYLGMIGSKSKVAKARKRFVEENILSKEILDAVDMPIGIKFNAESPGEIALSILAKMIDVKNAKR